MQLQPSVGRSALAAAAPPPAPAALGKQQLPTLNTLCTVFHSAETKQDKMKLKPCFVPLLQCLRPDVYGSIGGTDDNGASPRDYSRFPIDRPLLVCLSGGAGSLAAMWRMVCAGLDFEILFVENLFEEDVERKRRQCVRSVCLQARTRTGWPLVTEKHRGQVAIPGKSRLHTLLHTIRAPDAAKGLSRKAKIGLVVAAALQYYEQQQATLSIDDADGRGRAVFPNKPALVWGNVQDCFDMLDALQVFGFAHVVPFAEVESSLFALCEAEDITESAYARFKLLGESELAPCQLLPRQVSSLVCSCRSSPPVPLSVATTSTNVTPISSPSDVTGEPHRSSSNTLVRMLRPFRNMCQTCWGCQRYVECWSRVSKSMPCISWTSSESPWTTLAPLVSNLPLAQPQQPAPPSSTLSASSALQATPPPPALTGILSRPKIFFSFQDTIRDKRDGLERKKRSKKVQQKTTGIAPAAAAGNPPVVTTVTTSPVDPLSSSNPVGHNAPTKSPLVRPGDGETTTTIPTAASLSSVGNTGQRAVTTLKKRRSEGVPNNSDGPASTVAEPQKRSKIAPVSLASGENTKVPAESHRKLHRAASSYDPKESDDSQQTESTGCGHDDQPDSEEDADSEAEPEDEEQPDADVLLNVNDTLLHPSLSNLPEDDDEEDDEEEDDEEEDDEEEEEEEYGEPTDLFSDDIDLDAVMLEQDGEELLEEGAEGGFQEDDAEGGSGFLGGDDFGFGSDEEEGGGKRRRKRNKIE